MLEKAYGVSSDFPMPEIILSLLMLWFLWWLLQQLGSQPKPTIKPKPFSTSATPESQSVALKHSDFLAQFSPLR
ncbi:hypothetical protein H6F51_10435 [Cyanobacteria bacterium FACHB-DQ100]|nr:hypothetical protein [Cyanobacteria bacterium FACHB-DQ100]